MFNVRRAQFTRPRILLLLMVAMCAVLPLSQAAAATKPVSMVNFAFSPKALTVPVGTTVKWTNTTSIRHTATADKGTFNSGNVAASHAFSFTFHHAGTFRYYCMHHGAPGGVGMSGTIIVH